MEGFDILGYKRMAHYFYSMDSHLASLKMFLLIALKLRSFWDSNLFYLSYSFMKIQVVLESVIRLQQNNCPDIEQVNVIILSEKKNTQKQSGVGRFSIFHRMVNKASNSFRHLGIWILLYRRKYVFRSKKIYREHIRITLTS